MGPGATDLIVIPLELEDGTRMAVAVEPVGLTEVDSSGLVARLSAVTSSIEAVSSSVLTAVRRAAPVRASVELNFSLALEQGTLVALFGKASGQAAITVTLEWERDADPAPGGRGDDRAS